MAMAPFAKKLSGEQDSRGPVGMFTRGKNVYLGGNAAQNGGPNIGRPATAQLGQLEQQDPLEQLMPEQQVEPNIFQMIAQNFMAGQEGMPTPPTVNPLEGAINRRLQRGV